MNKPIQIACFFCFLPFYLSSIPVIFIHEGDSEYLKYALYQAKKFNKEVILLGDKSNNHYHSITWHAIKPYASRVADFKKIYKHMGDSPYCARFLSFQRWFILDDFMAKNNIDLCFYCDSDVMLYCNVTKEYEKFNNADLVLLRSLEEGLTSIKGYLCAGTISYFKKGALNLLCDYIMKQYQHPQYLESRYKNRPLSQKSHSICDMTLITMFDDAFKGKLSIQYDTDVIDWAQFDHQISCNENDIYEMKGFLGLTLKKLKWEKGIPYCFNKKLRKFIRFNALHCQGRSKKLMQHFFEERN